MPSPRSRRGMGLRSAEARAGLLGNALENPGDVARGAATAPFTAAPDLLGMAAQLYNVGMRPMGAPPIQNPISGDPIREAVGLDPQSSAGLLGEFLDPSSAIGKGARAVRSLLGNADKVAPTGLLGAMTLFHGTPHKFDRFDLSKIGTGEGAQAFGHGLYFAENPKVAGQYQRNVPRSSTKAQELNDLQIQKNRLNLNRQRPMSVQEELANDTKIKEIDELINQKKAEMIAEMEAPGHFYEVDIPDEVVDNMLDWDAPLSEQPESVQKALRQIGIEPSPSGADTRTGGDIIREMGSASFYDTAERQAKYNALSEKIGGSSTPRQIASEILNEAGIPGIRFFDGSSRSAGEGTRNIVLFDPDNIREVKRDGEVVFNRL